MRTYWRSLAQIEDRPEFRAAVEREFPEGASELPEGITRREMVMLLGASLSLAGLAGCRRPVEEIVPYVTAPEEIVPGIPRYYATTMPFGRSAYGLIVESHEGRPTKIEGNPSHPSTLGASSSRVQASVLGLYDPDRSQSITLKGARSSWNDFVTAWGQLSKAHAADGGARLAVLSESFSSPTLARLAAELRTRFPKVQWATYDAVSDENRLAGLRQATGRDVDLMLRLDRASVILCLDADPLLTDPETIRHARGFADGRRAGVFRKPGAGLQRRDEPALRRRRRLLADGSDGGSPAPSREPADRRVSRGARGAPRCARGLQPGGSGWLRYRPALDRRRREGPSGEPRQGVDYRRRAPARGRPRRGVRAERASRQHGHDGHLLRDEGRGAAERELAGLARLRDDRPARSRRSSSSAAILCSMPPPISTSPSAMAKVPHTIALGHTVDETSSRAEWHIPRAHYLESWGDARAVGGTLSVVQPLILPLFGGRTPVDVLGLMVGDKDRPGYDIVRDTWKPILGEADFDKKWNRVLHDGLLAGSELTEVVPTVKGEAFAELARATGSASGLEIVFVPSPSLHDGRFANDGWLQELPDPLTKLTWDNPALVSPKTAETLGLANEEVVRLEYAGRSLELPVWILPGMADGVVALTLGYGRRRAGRIGSGVGFDTFTVRSSKAPGFDSGVTLTTARAHVPAFGDPGPRQHGGPPPRPRVHAGRTSIGGIRAGAGRGRGRACAEGTPSALGVYPEETEHFSLWKEHTYDQGNQWGMTIDLNACIGCNACMTACQSENNVPVVGKIQVARQREMHWIRVDRYFSGEPSGNPEVVFQPVPCMHCEDAPCEQVCPVAATVHDGEGLNVMVYNRCIGTRYCSNNCPYKVRRFNFFNFTKDTPDILKLAMNPDVTVRARGVMEKCTYCTQRINRAKIDAKLAGRALRDGDVKTACQQACPASAIEFGNIRDASSRVAKAKADPRNYALLDELNTKPRTTYLAKVRNPNPDLEGEGAV